MGKLATVIIPVSDYHQSIVHRAIASAEAQTIPCDIIVVNDEQSRGSGWARNQGLDQVTTDFLLFLDADDWIEPSFVEQCLKVWKPGFYVYTDWYEDSVLHEAPDCPWINQTAHVVTALIPTKPAQMIRFDENFIGAEDTDWFVHLTTEGTCGIRLPLALFHYGGDGLRSKTFRASPEYIAIMSQIKQRYGGKRMGCCGDNNKKPTTEKQDGDVLAQALWQGNRRESGRVSGRRYPRLSFPQTTWVDPRDVRANPRLWKIIDNPPPVIPTVDSEGVMRALGWSTPPAPAPAAPTRPDVARVLRLAGVRPDPVFVRPDKDYASYRDFWRLVELAGFPIRRMSDFGEMAQVFIFVTPEPLPDVSTIPARCITWEFEYSGEYVHDLKNWTGEVWSSDRAHAESIGARFVMLGSDARLAERQRIPPSYDLAMLAYMTPRRQTMKDTLSSYRWAQDYADGDQRADLLAQTRLLLHVHQHERAPYAAPLRYALAAAYDLPVVSETIADMSPYRGAIYFADYDYLPQAVEYALQHTSGGALHKLLCETHTFRAEVEKVLWG